MTPKEKPAEDDGGSFEVADWKAYQKNTLQAFMTIVLPSGLQIHDVTFHIKNGSRWVSFPARKYEKADKTEAWTPVVEIEDADARRDFQKRALKAIDAYLFLHELGGAA